MEVKVLKSEPLLLGEVEKELKNIKKKDRLPVQEKSYDFARKFEKLKIEKAKQLIEEIRKLEIPRITDFHIYQIADLMPKSLVELRSIFAGTKTTVTPDNIKQIYEIIKKYEK